MEGTATLEQLRHELSDGRLPMVSSMGRGESLFGTLLRSVITLEWEPGSLITERGVMDATGTTRALLRHALTRLTELGLIRTMPRRGIHVTPLDSLDVSTIYDARWAIETRAARLAAVRAQPRDIDALREVGQQAAAQDLDQPRTIEVTSRFLAHDQALHLLVARAARNPLLEDALTRILPLNARLWHWAYRSLGVDQRVMFHHHEIVDAISARDPDAAEAAAGHHLQSSREILTDVFTTALRG